MIDSNQIVPGRGSGIMDRTEAILESISIKLDPLGKIIQGFSGGSVPVTSAGTTQATSPIMPGGLQDKVAIQLQALVEALNKLSLPGSALARPSGVTKERGDGPDPSTMGGLHGRVNDLLSMTLNPKEMASQEGFKGAAGKSMMALGNENELQSMGGMMGAMGNLAAMIPGIGQVSQGILKFGEGLMNGVDGLKTWGQTLMNANLEFSKFSAAMAGVSARAEMRQIRLEQERGQRRAGSAESLAEAQNKLERAVAPLGDAWANMKSEFAAVLLTLVAKPFEYLNKLVLGISNKMDKDDSNSDSWRGWFQQTADRRAAEIIANQGLPRRLAGGDIPSASDPGGP